MKKIDLNDRYFLICLREEAEKRANTPGTNPTWVRTFLDLANAADHLDGMVARCQIETGTEKRPIKVVIMDSSKEK